MITITSIIYSSRFLQVTNQGYGAQSGNKGNRGSVSK